MNSLELLQTEAKNDSWSHAYLLIGSDSTTMEMAQFIISSNEVKSSDIVDLKADSESGKKAEIKAEETRNFISRIYLSALGKKRIGIIYEADKLNIASANILLKTLEEPPRNVIIILLSQTENIISTVRSRCRIYRSNNNVQPEKNPEDHTLSYAHILEENLCQIFHKIEELVKNNETEIFLENMAFDLEKELQSGDKSAEKLLERLFQTKKMIRANANPRLALENFALNLRITYGK